MIAKTWDPISLTGLKFKYGGINASGQAWGTARALQEAVPWYYNDLKYLGDPTILSRVVAGMIKCVIMGEDKYQQAFGGDRPESNEFGYVPLRPVHVDKVNNRWRWTSGTTSTINWSAEDNFIASFNLAQDEMMLIYGYYNLEPVPNTLELYFQPGSQKLPIITIEPMRVKGEPYFIFPKPLIIEPSSQFAVTASVKSGTTATSEEAGLLGYMFAKNSKLLVKKRVVS